LGSLRRLGTVGDSGLRSLLKPVLVVWTLGYPVISYSPLLLAGQGAGGAAAGGLAALFAASFLLVPWLIGIVVLGVLVAVVR